MIKIISNNAISYPISHINIKIIINIKRSKLTSISLAPYNPLSARIHVRRLRELLSSTTNTNTSVLSSLTLKQQEEIEQKEEYEVKSVTKSKKKKKRRQQQRKQTQSKINKEEDDKKNELNFNFNTECEIKDFFPPTETHILECVQYICYSGWNPPPKHRAIQGDLFYLVLKTLEGRVVHITAHSGGFYINGTTDSSFSPSPIDNAHHSHSLIGLLNQVLFLFPFLFLFFPLFPYIIFYLILFIYQSTFF